MLLRESLIPKGIHYLEWLSGAASYEGPQQDAAQHCLQLIENAAGGAWESAWGFVADKRMQGLSPAVCPICFKAPKRLVHGRHPDCWLWQTPSNAYPFPKVAKGSSLHYCPICFDARQFTHAKLALHLVQEHSVDDCMAAGMCYALLLRIEPRMYGLQHAFVCAHQPGLGFASPEAVQAQEEAARVSALSGRSCAQPLSWALAIQEANPHRAFLVAGGGTSKFQPMLEPGSLPYYIRLSGDTIRYVYGNSCFAKQYAPAMDIASTLRFHHLLAECSASAQVCELQVCTEALAVVVKFDGAAEFKDFRELARTQQLTVEHLKEAVRIVGDMAAKFLTYMPFCFDPRYWLAVGPHAQPSTTVHFTEARSCTASLHVRVQIAPIFKYLEGHELKIRQESDYGCAMLVLRCCTEWLDPSVIKDADNTSMLQRRMFNMEHLEVCAARRADLFGETSVLGQMMANCVAGKKDRVNPPKLVATLLEAFTQLVPVNLPA